MIFAEDFNGNSEGKLLLPFKGHHMQVKLNLNDGTEITVVSDDINISYLDC